MLSLWYMLPIPFLNGEPHGDRLDLGDSSVLPFRLMSCAMPLPFVVCGTSIELILNYLQVFFFFSNYYLIDEYLLFNALLLFIFISLKCRTE